MLCTLAESPAQGPVSPIIKLISCSSHRYSDAFKKANSCLPSLAEFGKWVFTLERRAFCPLKRLWRPLVTWSVSDHSISWMSFLLPPSFPEHLHLQGFNLPSVCVPCRMYDYCASALFFFLLRAKNLLHLKRSNCIHLLVMIINSAL